MLADNQPVPTTASKSLNSGSIELIMTCWGNFWVVFLEAWSSDGAEAEYWRTVSRFRP